MDGCSSSQKSAQARFRSYDRRAMRDLTATLLIGFLLTAVAGATGPHGWPQFRPLKDFGVEWYREHA